MKNCIRKPLLAAGLLLVTAFASAADWAPGSTDWAALPEIKRSKLGLYLTPQQAYDMKKKDQQGVAFFDIRTRAEAMRALSDRLALPAIANWVGAVLAAEKQGASLGPILRAQAEQRRMERFVRAEQQALKAPVKMLFPLVACIFPCTFVIVFFPIAVRLVFEGLV